MIWGYFLTWKLRWQKLLGIEMGIDMEDISSGPASLALSNTAKVHHGSRTRHACRLYSDIMTTVE